jgi:hypothetical protein
MANVPPSPFEQLERQKKGYHTDLHFIPKADIFVYMLKLSLQFSFFISFSVTSNFVLFAVSLEYLKI